MSIEVSVKLFGVPNKRAQQISLEEGTRNLRSLLKALAKEKSAEYIKDGCVVTINRKLVVNDQELQDKDEITIMPMLHGG